MTPKQAITSPLVSENAKDHIIQGKAPQLESYLLERVYGKPMINWK
jgi:hypothetical protein